MAKYTYSHLAQQGSRARYPPRRGALAQHYSNPTVVPSSDSPQPSSYLLLPLPSRGGRSSCSTEVEKKKSSFNSGNRQVPDKPVQENRSELNLVPRMESPRRYHCPDSALGPLPPPRGQLLGSPLHRRSPYDLSGPLASAEASGLFGGDVSQAERKKEKNIIWLDSPCSWNFCVSLVLLSGAKSNGNPIWGRLSVF